MKPDAHDTEDSNASEQPANYLQAVLARLPGRSPRVEASYDSSGRFWLEDSEGGEDAYAWMRNPIDLEAVR